MTGNVPQRIGSLHPNIAPYGEIFTTKDNRQITFAIGSNQHFEKLCDYLNLSELKENFKFKYNQNRVSNRKVLFEILEKKIVNLTSEDIFEQMKKMNVPCGIIKNLAEVFESKQAQELIREEEIDGNHTKRTTSIAFQWK
jgi:crotonobetainyl-CoA:carnitine CoA-transferase CaiB-like acyl-CoA transferase